ncbi:MAG: hypothetical protein M3Z95_06525 [Actinomycetota bacterium]|nr:hypothetical protein [Actinomycetota bacterium]
MTPRPYRPVRELEGAIERGELDFALALAREVTLQRGRPLDLQLALGLLSLVAIQRSDAYDGWALRWLGRWISESRQPTIEQAAEVAGSLADLPCEPDAALEVIRRTCRLE